MEKPENPVVGTKYRVKDSYGGGYFKPGEIISLKGDNDNDSAEFTNGQEDWYKDWEYLETVESTESKFKVGDRVKISTSSDKDMTQPMKNYYRLDWVDMEDDEFIVTSAGTEALKAIAFGITDAKDLADYAAKEVARISKEEKERK